MHATTRSWRPSLTPRTPDYAAALLGWRAWLVVRQRDGLFLRSAVYDECWEPRRPLRARCLAVATRRHPAPALGCACGVYGARRPASAARYLVGRNAPDVVHRVLGVAALWGDVAEGEGGWRAELAYPAGLWVPSADTAGRSIAAAEVAAALAVYGVPVALLERFEPRAVVAELGYATAS